MERRGDRARALRKLACPPIRIGVDFIHQAGCDGFTRVDPASRQQIVLRTEQADCGNEPGGDTAGRGVAERDFREPEPGRRMDDDEIGGECELRAAAHGIPADARDDWAPQPRDQRGDLLDGEQRSPQLLGLTGRRCEAFPEILSDAEGAPVPGQEGSPAHRHSCAGRRRGARSNSTFMAFSDAGRLC